MPVQKSVLLSNATAAQTGQTVPMPTLIAGCTFYAEGATSSGAGAVSIAIEASNTENAWVLLGTISLTLGTVITGDGIPVVSQWLNCRARVTSISGTNAYVNAIMVAGV